MVTRGRSVTPVLTPLPPPLTPEQKHAEQERAGLAQPASPSDGLSWPDAEAKGGRLEARVAEARAAVIAAEAEMAELRAARVRAELAEQPGPDPATLKAAEGRLASARDLLADREEAVTAFMPIHRAAQRRDLAAQAAVLDQACDTQQAAIHELERQRTDLEISRASGVLQDHLGRRATIQRQSDDLARTMAAPRRI